MTTRFDDVPPRCRTCQSDVLQGEPPWVSMADHELSAHPERIVPLKSIDVPAVKAHHTPRSTTPHTTQMHLVVQEMTGAKRSE